MGSVTCAAAPATGAWCGGRGSSVSGWRPLAKELVEWNDREATGAATAKCGEELGRRDRVGGVVVATARAGRAVYRRILGAVRENILEGLIIRLSWVEELREV